MDEIFEFAFVPVKGTKKTDFLPGDPPELVRQGNGCSARCALASEPRIHEPSGTGDNLLKENIMMQI